MDQGLALAVAAAALTHLLGRRVLDWLIRRQIMDMPNDRSSHTIPTPRGGGLATTPVMAGLILALAWQHGDAGLARLAGGALILLAVCWIDDRKGLPALPRFLAQGAVIALVLAFESRPILWDGLPLVLDHGLVGLGWLWFVNLYNFMDGIDGITGSQSACLGAGIALAAVLAGLAPPVFAAALIVAAVGAAFLLLNWHPARIFMGDSGSVPLGLVLGGLLVELAAAGYLAAALILPLYYLADATITLARRALNGEKVWQPHRKHFYQRAVQGGKSHDQVVLTILAGNLGLILFAALAVKGFWPASLLCAILVVALILARLSHWAKGKAP